MAASSSFEELCRQKNATWDMGQPIDLVITLSKLSLAEPWNTPEKCLECSFEYF
jgi:hypothetical protein